MVILQLLSFGFGMRKFGLGVKKLDATCKQWMEACETVFFIGVHP